LALSVVKSPTKNKHADHSGSWVDARGGARSEHAHHRFRAGSRPSRPAPATLGARHAGDEDGWQTRPSRNARRAHAHARQQVNRVRPAASPLAGGAASRIPAALHGRGYNCGDDDRIAAQSKNPIMCMRSGGFQCNFFTTEYDLHSI
jgi:hypothetical protein